MVLGALDMSYKTQSRISFVFKTTFRTDWLYTKRSIFPQVVRWALRGQLWGAREQGHGYGVRVWGQGMGRPPAHAYSHTIQRLYFKSIVMFCNKRSQAKGVYYCMYFYITEYGQYIH